MVAHARHVQMEFSNVSALQSFKDNVVNSVSHPKKNISEECIESLQYLIFKVKFVNRVLVSMVVHAVHTGWIPTLAIARSVILVGIVKHVSTDSLGFAKNIELVDVHTHSYTFKISTMLP
jgi:hypothetical protein